MTQRELHTANEAEQQVMQFLADAAAAGQWVCIVGYVDGNDVVMNRVTWRFPHTHVFRAVEKMKADLEAVIPLPRQQEPLTPARFLQQIQEKQPERWTDDQPERWTDDQPDSPIAPIVEWDRDDNGNDDQEPVG